MLKKNYRYLLSLLILCACKKETQEETLNKEYVDAYNARLLEEKKNFLDKFSETELRTIAVQGFFNELKKFDEKCKTQKELRNDPDIAQQILNGFLFLYDSSESKDPHLDLVDEQQKKFILQRLYDAELVLEQQEKYQHILHRVYFILGNEKSRVNSQKFEMQDLTNHLECFFIKKYGSLKKLYLTETGEDAANKISSLVYIYQNYKNLPYEQFSFIRDSKIKALESKLISIASKILIDNGCVLKESDKAKSNFLHPTYLMEILKSLLPYNTNTGIEKYKEFRIADDNLRKFIFNIIWLALLSTSDSVFAEFRPNFDLYLKFYNLDIQDAFEIFALLKYFFSEVFVSADQVKDVPDLSTLDYAFRKSDYYYPLKKDDGSEKSLEEQIEEKRKIDASNRINELGKIIYEGCYKKTISASAGTIEILNKIFYRHIYQNITDGKGDHCFAFGYNEDKNKFMQDIKIWNQTINSRANFQQKSIPSYFISSLLVRVVDNSIACSYSDEIQKDYFPSLKTSDNSLFRETILFTNQMLEKGISLKACQNFKSFAKSVFEKQFNINPLSQIKDVFDFRFTEQGIKVPKTDFGVDIFLPSDIEKIITLIESNRNDKMTFEEVLLERMLNVCLLQALTQEVFIKNS